MSKLRRSDIEAILSNLAACSGNIVTGATQHIEKMFPPTELSLWMDIVGGHAGGWYHRVRHGHDFLANVELVYKNFGVKGVVQYPVEIAKDALTPHGVPVPGVQHLYEANLIGAKDATQWLSITSGKCLVAGIAIYTTYRLYKKTRSGTLDRRSVIWASVGVVTKVTSGVVTHNAVLILSGCADAVLVLDNLADIRSNLEKFFDFVVSDEMLHYCKVGGVATLAGGTAVASTFALTATVGTASTGTAIASLSGAAATKATLAALGGGALSVGGFGVVGGVAVLTGGGLLIAAGVGAVVWYYSNAFNRSKEPSA